MAWLASPVSSGPYSINSLADTFLWSEYKGFSNQWNKHQCFIVIWVVKDMHEAGKEKVPEYERKSPKHLHNRWAQNQDEEKENI